MIVPLWIFKNVTVVLFLEPDNNFWPSKLNSSSHKSSLYWVTWTSCQTFARSSMTWLICQAVVYRLTFNLLSLIQWCNEGQTIWDQFSFRSVVTSSAIQQWNIKPLPPSESSLKPYCPPFTSILNKTTPQPTTLDNPNQSFCNLLYISIWSQGALLLPCSPDTVFHCKTSKKWAKRTDGFMLRCVT